MVVLRDVHGMSHREIAEELEISEAAAKVRLHRARARLRDGLIAWRPSTRAPTSTEASEPEESTAEVIDIDSRRNAS